MTLYYRSLLLFLAACFFANPAKAFIGFGSDPIDTTPQEQTQLSEDLYFRAVAAEEEGRKATARRMYRRIFKKYPASDYSGEALFRLGRLEFERKNWKKSFRAFQTILAFHPDFPEFNDLIRYQFDIAMRNAEGDGIRLFFVIPYRAYNASVGFFETVVINAPYSELAPISLMNVALIHQYRGNTANAIDALDRLINNYPSSLLADDAYLNLAETFASLVQGAEYDQGATREAMSYFEDFLILFSENEKLIIAEQGLAEMEDVYARSKLIIGEYYFRWRKWYNAAEIFFNETITVAPDSPSAQKARDYLERIEDIRENAPPPKDPSEESFMKRFIRRILS